MSLATAARGPNSLVCIVVSVSARLATAVHFHCFVRDDVELHFHAHDEALIGWISYVADVRGVSLVAVPVWLCVHVDVCGKSVLYCWTWAPGCHSNATFHRHPHRNAHASCSMLPLTGTSTYAQKSWGGHPRCDLAPLTTSFGTVGQWERQHLAMAGSRHHHYPLYATAHRAARANYHVPLWRSGLAVPASCWSTRIPEVFCISSLPSISLLCGRLHSCFSA